MKKRIFLAVILIAAVVITAGCAKNNTPREDPAATQPESVPSQEPAEEPNGQGVKEVNFTETGNMVNWDSATETYTDTWTLIYEKPGNPAIPAELTFSDASVCSINGEQEKCLEAINNKKITNGARVKVEGNTSGGKVTVVNFTLISPGE